MSLYYTPNAYRHRSPNSDHDDSPLRDVQSNLRPQQRPSREDRLRQRQTDTSLNDGAETGSIFIFPQPPSSASPVPSNPHYSPRLPYSEDSIIFRPAHRRSNTAASRRSHVSQSENFTDLDGLSTPTTTVTLSIGSSPISAFTDVGGEEGSIDDGRIEAMLWGWDESIDEGADRPCAELRRNPRSVCPDDAPPMSLVGGSEGRPWPLYRGSGERIGALIEREQLRDQWRGTSRFQYTQQPRSRSYSPLSTPSSSREVDLLSLAPHPKIRIPFLDFFVSLLGVDESTVDLLTLCSTAETHGSVLFPGHTIQPLPAPRTMADEEDGLSSTVTSVDQNIGERGVLHGFHRALLSPGMERDSWASLKEGLVVFYNTAASMPTQSPGRILGLAQLWGVVSHVCVRGGEVIKSVCSATPTSPGTGGVD